MSEITTRREAPRYYPWLVAVMGMLALSIWIFASFVAEAHGFPKVLPVIGVTIAAALAVAMAVAVLLAGIIDPASLQPPG